MTMRSALITGAGNGIGAALAKQLASEGVRVSVRVGTSLHAQLFAAPPTVPAQALMHKQLWCRCSTWTAPRLSRRCATLPCSQCLLV